MSEPQPSERDREMARDALARWGINASRTLWYVEPGVTFERALTGLLAAAREEGCLAAFEGATRAIDAIVNTEMSGDPAYGSGL